MVTRTCGACGATNRIPPKHLADKGKCGRCKAELSPLDRPYAVPDTGSFDQIVGEATVPVLVDFWAPWCGPCRMVGPELEKAARSLAGKAVVLKVNTDELSELAQRYQIRGIPDFMVFRGGKQVFEQAGAVRHQDFVRWVERAAAA